MKLNWKSTQNYTANYSPKHYYLTEQIQSWDSTEKEIQHLHTYIYINSQEEWFAVNYPLGMAMYLYSGDKHHMELLQLNYRIVTTRYTWRSIQGKTPIRLVWTNVIYMVV